MLKLLIDRKFLSQFDKGDKQNPIICELPKDFSLRYITTNEKKFDLKDDKDNKQNPILHFENDGSITYVNETDISINIIDYEYLIQSFPALINTGKRTPKCCDYILYSEDGNFFICNELSVSDKKNKWPDAKDQFADTIRRLNNCKEISSIINQIPNKICLLSTKMQKIDSPDGIVDAFDIPNQLIKKPEEILNTIINRMNFKIWESNLFIYNQDSTITISMRN